jgi:two-component system, OmpR family, response regulator MtrA
MAKKLLVIDDQSGITKVVEMIARQIGLNTRSLNSSAQATETFIAFRPDILILDMIMPEKDGIDVLNEILLTGLPIKIVLTSGVQRLLPAFGRRRRQVPREPECFHIA